jgi:hypothetical protein
MTTPKWDSTAPTFQRRAKETLKHMTRRLRSAKSAAARGVNWPEFLDGELDIQAERLGILIYRQWCDVDWPVLVVRQSVHERIEKTSGGYVLARAATVVAGDLCPHLRAKCSDRGAESSVAGRA